MEPLLLPGVKDPEDELSEWQESTEEPLQCILCTTTFTRHKEEPYYASLLDHMKDSHSLVIGEANLIANFRKYLDYWRVRFKAEPPGNVCHILSEEEAKKYDVFTGKRCHLLHSAIQEDKKLREELQLKRLEYILHQQQKERNDDTFTRGCLFCRKHFVGNRAELFNHLTHDHNFNIGRPDNIVFGKELLDVLEDKLKKLQCLYCEKIFKDWNVLKEHMRKKQHKRINPNNRMYDKYYIVNYLEPGKDWKAVQEERDSCSQDFEDENSLWDDWKEEQPGTVCLFCEHTCTEKMELLHHMKESHNFSFEDIRTTLKLSFYQQVKFINYIRRQMYDLSCFSCNERFDSHDVLLEHLLQTDHIASLPDATLWDQPQFYFPTYENDYLLCVLDDSEENSSPDADDPLVISEDPVAPSGFKYPEDDDLNLDS